MKQTKNAIEPKGFSMRLFAWLFHKCMRSTYQDATHRIFIRWIGQMLFIEMQRAFTEDNEPTTAANIDDFIREGYENVAQFLPIQDNMKKVKEI